MGGWASAKESWNNATSFIQAMASRGLTDNKVDPTTKALRVLSCHGNGSDVPPCQHRGYSDKGQGYHFCNQCGCGQREMARTSALGSAKDSPIFNEAEYDKLDYPVLNCPVAKPGFSNHVPPVVPATII